MILVHIVSKAETELRSAVAWYNEQQAGLGVKFAESVRECIALISDMPELFHCDENGIYTCLVNSFPYIIAYKVSEYRIEILAIAHAKRQYRYWVSRIDDLREEYPWPLTRERDEEIMDEVHRRMKRFEAGGMPALSMDEVMAKYR